MLPSVLTSQLQTGVEDFLRTTFPTTTPHFHGMLGRFSGRGIGERHVDADAFPRPISHA